MFKIGLFKAKIVRNSSLLRRIATKKAAYFGLKMRIYELLELTFNKPDI